MTELNNKLGASDFMIVEVTAVPADFIKNISEERKTGLKLGSMLLSKQAVKSILNVFSKFYCKYILKLSKKAGVYII